MQLVADVGGTNTRFALADSGVVDEVTIDRVANDDVPGFDAALSDYFTRQTVRPDRMVIAVAGPVADGHASLTNRAWDFDATALADRFDVGQVSLINDLKALAMAVPVLTSDCLTQVVPRSEQTPEIGQAAVIGIGTGFNVCQVVQENGMWTYPGGEVGHIQLPHTIMAELRAELGDGAARFATIEDLFSGRGYQAVCAHLMGAEQSARDITYDTAAPFMDYYAHLIALLAREMLLTFMPRSGIYFSGSVARAVLEQGSAARFTEDFRAPFELDSRISAPVAIINDDFAALRGCARWGV